MIQDFKALRIKHIADLLPGVQYANDSVKKDLEDPSSTRTELVHVLSEIQKACGHPLLILMLKTGHHYDGPGLHGHNPGPATPGDSADIWHADYKTVGDPKIKDVIVACRTLAESGDLAEVGLGGVAKQYDPGNWPSGFDHFPDNNSDHVHVSATIAGVPNP